MLINYLLFQRILIDRQAELKNDFNTYLKIIEQNNNIYTFIYLIENTPYLDVKEICIKMIKLLHQQENQNIEDQKLCSYISTLLESINNGKKQGISPLLSTEASNEKNKIGNIYFDEDALKQQDQNGIDEKLNEKLNNKEQGIQIKESQKQQNKKKNNKFQLNSEDLFQDNSNDFTSFPQKDNQIKSNQTNNDIQRDEQSTDIQQNDPQKLLIKQNNTNFQVPQKPQRKNIKSFQLSNDAFEENNVINEEVKNKQNQLLSINNPENGFSTGEEQFNQQNQEESNIIQKPSFKSKKKQLQLGDETMGNPYEDSQFPSQKEENTNFNQKKSSKQGFKKNLMIEENEVSNQQLEQNDNDSKSQNQFNQNDIKKPMLSNNFMDDNDGYNFQPLNEPYDSIKVANKPGFNQAPSMSNKRSSGAKFGFPAQIPAQQPPQEEVTNGFDFGNKKNGENQNKFSFESNGIPSIGGPGNFMEAKMSSRAAQQQTFAFPSSKSKNIAPLSNVDDSDSQVIQLPKRNIKPKGLIIEEDEIDQEEEQKKDKQDTIELNNKQQKQPQPRNKKPNLFIQNDEANSQNNEKIENPPQIQNTTANKKTGKTGTASYKKKIGGLLELNIDKVNENYMKGGGETAVKQQEIVDTQKEEQEIAELASICVKYITGELKYEEYDYYNSRMPNLNQKQLNGPISVRGIKNIDFSQTGQTYLENSQHLLNAIAENSVQENDTSFSSMQFNKEQSIGPTPKNLQILNKKPFNSSQKDNFLATDDLILAQKLRDEIMNEDFLQEQTYPENNQYKQTQDFQDTSIQNVKNGEIPKPIINQITTDEMNKETQDQQIRNEIFHKISKILEQQEQQKSQQMQVVDENSRCARNLWKKIWKRLRIYDGLWRPQGIQNQFDRPFDEQNQSTENNPFYTLKIDKFETRNRMRPFLKLELIEPKYAIEDQINNKLLSTNYSLDINQNNQSNQLHKSNGQDLQSLIPCPQENSQASQGDNSHVLIQKNILVNQEVQFTKKCQWIKTLTTRNGNLSMTDDNLVFQYQSIEQRESHTTVTTNKIPKDKSLIKLWPLKQIKEVQTRKYFLKRTAVEIFFLDGSCVLLNFPQNNQDCEEVSQKLIRNRKKRCPNIVYHNTLDSRKLIEKTNITTKWQNRQISNFEYLMSLNGLASRNYQDLTQYPVFPWVIADYKSQDTFKSLRDFNKSMGALGSKERAETYKKNFASIDHSQNIPPYHYGSHYSSQEIVLQYMWRIQPFTNGSKILQRNNKLNILEKLFQNLEYSYKSATENIQDVRELVPEFFYLPELFINLNNESFSISKQSQIEGNAVIPQWADKNPYKFVVLNRKVLESEAVSLQINNWIDLIFGYKQSGKEAENNLNVFYHLSYDQKVDLDQIKDESIRISTQTQIINFGQTPSQLFLEKPHLIRINQEDIFQGRNIADPLAKIKVFRPSVGKKKRSQAKEYKMVNFFSNILDESIILLKWINDTRLICLRRNGQITQFRWYSNPTQPSQSTSIPFQCGEDKKKQITLNKSKNSFINHMDQSINYVEYPCYFLKESKIVAIGGIWDGVLKLVNIDTDQVIETHQVHSETVTYITSDNKENFLISGSKIGEVIVWKINHEQKKLTVRHMINDHRDRITQIKISKDLLLFATASEDSTINLYNLISGVFYRTFFHPDNLPIDNVISIIFESLKCPVGILTIALYRTIYSYSINGQFLSKCSVESQQISSSLILRDNNFSEIIIYGNEKGDVTFRELPFLELRKVYNVSVESPVLSIVASKDKRFLLCGCGDGHISVLTDPLKAKQDS